jgi:hypothetical protein
MYDGQDYKRGTEHWKQEFINDSQSTTGGLAESDMADRE